MSTKEQKKTIRDQARKNLERMTVDPAAADAVRDLFFEHMTLEPGQIVSAYWPMGREFDVLPLYDALCAQDVVCALPVIEQGSRVLSFRTWKEGEALEKGAYDIPVPTGGESVKPDVLLLPLLAFDQRGYRLGQGGGYYDATLAHLRSMKEAVAIGVGYAEQACLFPLPAEAHDQKLDAVITPQKVWQF